MDHKFICMFLSQAQASFLLKLNIYSQALPLPNMLCKTRIPMPSLINTTTSKKTRNFNSNTL